MQTYDVVFELLRHVVGLEEVQRHLDLVALLQVNPLHLVVHLLVDRKR